MIAAGEPREFVPYGREHVKRHHPGNCFPAAQQDECSYLGKLGQDTNKDLLTALKKVSLGNVSKDCGSWQLQQGLDEFEEEELFISDQVVVWSKSNGHGTCKLQKSFTFENPVLQAMWCNSFTSSHLLKSELVEEISLNSICVLENVNLHVLVDSGHIFITALPFQVSKLWPCKYGLLFERKAESFENDMNRKEWEKFPSVFSLLHPRDEVTPVVTNSGKVSYFMDKAEVIVFSCVEPSIAVTYNYVSQFHTVWNVRYSSQDERNETSLFNRQGLESPLPAGKLSWTAANSPTLNQTMHKTHISSFGRFTPSVFSPSQSSSMSPQTRQALNRGHLTGINSPTILGLSRPQSPLVTSTRGHMATLSRYQSPTVSNLIPSRRFSFSTTPPSNSRSYTRSPSDAHMPISSDWLMNEMGVSIEPNICFEALWVDKQSPVSKSEKIFFSTDISGQKFLCFFLKDEKKLRLVKIEESNDFMKLIFGATFSISLRDVEPIPSLKMMLALDHKGTFTLFTGGVKVCKVHIPGNLGLLDSLPSVNRWRYSLSSGTPRRSSLAPNSKGMEVKFKDELYSLSPVPTHIESPSEDRSFLNESSFGPNAQIAHLRDGLNFNVTLESTTGDFYRIDLPKLSTSDIVTKCLEAFKTVLPKDISSQLIIKWYMTRNAPGPCDLTAQSELAAFLNCLLGMLGYDVEFTGINDGASDGDWLFSPIVMKKLKTSEQGSEEDWSAFLSLSSKKSSSFECKLMGINRPSKPKTNPQMNQSSVNTASPLYTYLPAILYTVHIVYEESKVNLVQWNLLPYMAKFLHLLAGTLNLEHYQDHYWRDCPKIINHDRELNLVEVDKRSFNQPSYFSEQPPCIFTWLRDCFTSKKISPFPYIPCVTTQLRNIALLYNYFLEGKVNSDQCLCKVVAPGQRFPEELMLNYKTNDKEYNQEEQLVLLVSNLGFSWSDLECLPWGVSLPLKEIIFRCRKKPPADWPASAYSLMRRQELSFLSQGQSSLNQIFNSDFNCKKEFAAFKDDDDGIAHLNYHVLKLRFSKDQRIMDVYRMLQSSSPVRIALTQRPEISDHEFIEEQEKHLYSVCIRTMALPLGRGMFTLQTCTPVITETLPIPKLCLTGRAPPRNISVDLTHIDVPANMNTWPLFHNGVAAGLRIAPNASEIHSTWIVYNKPRSLNSTDAPTEHAGFLMGLGLNGHLKNLKTMSVHDYLCKGHELTSVGLLLGVAASKRGTMDVSATKMMSIHLEALLPPTSTELDVPPMVQVAAVLGVGLLYQGSVHRHMAEVLLGEIGRPPGPEMEHCVDRESYALAAGLSLGLITFGKGSEVAALADLPMADELYHFMVGGHKRPLTGVHKEKQKSPSYQIREGDSVNVDVTSPGATLALGMMFFNTGNRSVSEWMNAPDTQYLLDMVRPDFLMLRTISHSLILWEDVLPSRAWVESHIPMIVSAHALQATQTSSDIDYETMSQAYCNIIAGACMGLGLKFAGSANDEAIQTLMSYARMFLSLSGKPVAEQAGKSTIETCLNVTVVAAGLVMAGTGDLEVLRICRLLRSRINQTSSYVQYGSHMATHLALGLLFLGGGRFTLKTTPDAIGALLCAFFPKFPTHSNDNRYHLQAFRHLYVLAVEPRLVIPRDIDTGQVIYTHLKIIFKDTDRYKGASYTAKAPVLLPELKYLKEVLVDDIRYWPITFDHKQTWKSLRTLLDRNGYIYVKQKAGCLPYTEDPKGFKSKLSQNIMQDTVHGWAVKKQAVSAFSCDPLVLHFSEKFLLPNSKSSKEGELQKQLCVLLFECAKMEKTEAFSAYLQMLQLLSGNHSISTLVLWQLRLVLDYMKQKQNLVSEDALLNPDFALAVKVFVENGLNNDIKENMPALSNYLRGRKGLSQNIAEYLTFNSIPHAKMDDFISTGLPSIYFGLKQLDLSTRALMVLMTALRL